MNWTKIKEKNPKAFEKCSEFLKQYEFHYGEWFCKKTGVGMNYYIERDLFSFFDEQGIYIEVYVLGINDDFTASDWQYDIANERIEEIDYPTRTLAEEQAYEKAFPILEEKL